MGKKNHLCERTPKMASVCTSSLSHRTMNGPMGTSGASGASMSSGDRSKYGYLPVFQARCQKRARSGAPNETTDRWSPKKPRCGALFIVSGKDPPGAR